MSATAHKPFHASLPAPSWRPGRFPTTASASPGQLKDALGRSRPAATCAAGVVACFQRQRPLRPAAGHSRRRSWFSSGATSERARPQRWIRTLRRRAPRLVPGRRERCGHFQETTSEFLGSLDPPRMALHPRSLRIPPTGASARQSWGPETGRSKPAAHAFPIQGLVLSHAGWCGNKHPKHFTPAPAPSGGPSWEVGPASSSNVTSTRGPV